MPNFNIPGATAYAASLKGDARQDYMAFVCPPGLPTRSEMLNSFKAVVNPALLRVVDGGPVEWGGDGSRNFVFLYERPVGNVLTRNLQEPRTPLNEDALLRQLIQPIGRVLSDLAQAGLFHGGVRPQNLYVRDTGGGWQLGECLCLPPSYGQPAVFESINRAQCPPAARGPGGSSDDVFALGVCILYLMLGRQPGAGMDDAALIQARLERGSYQAYVGQQKISGAYVELLRGMLADDTRARWDAADVAEWLDGRRGSPRQGDGMRRAQRAFVFQGKDYVTPRVLAFALSRNVQAAGAALDGPELDRWLRRSLDDTKRAEEMERVLEEVRAKPGANLEDRMVARACMALDPPGPLRYRGVTMMAGGVASQLAETVQKGQVQVVAEVIAHNLAGAWLEGLTEDKSAALPAIQMLEKVKSWVEKSSIGQGVERVLYELNPTLPCQSPLIKMYYPLTVKDVLIALDRLAQRPDRPAEPMDRHIAAFLLTRDRRTSDALLAMSGGDDKDPKRIVALLTVLTQAQFRHGPDKLPHLAGWFANLAEIAINRYHLKPMRDELRKTAKRVAADGNLEKILQLVDDPKRVDRDQKDFDASQLLFAARAKKIAELKYQNANEGMVAETMGQSLAVTVSIVVSLALMTVGALAQLGIL